MTKLVQNDIESLTNEQSALAALNSNYTLLENFSDTVLSRDGTTPNQMLTDLDLNGNNLLNVGNLVTSAPVISTPASSTDNAVVRWDGLTGKIIQNSTILIGDTGTTTPSANDGAALGSGTNAWSDLFLASGGVINWNNGNVTLTHSGNALTYAGLSSGFTIQGGTATSQWEVILKPSDHGTNKPYLSFKKETTPDQWTILLWDGGDTGGTINILCDQVSIAGTLACNSTASFAATMTSGLGVSTADVSFEMGSNRTGNGNCILDMHAASGTDFEARILRNSGANGAFDIVNTGTGALNFSNGGTVKFSITNADPTVRPDTATPAGGSTSARLLFGTTAGFGVYYGSGAPSVSAAQGSIYLRSDGSGTTTRLYVNTNGSTTWTNVTTAA